MFERLEAILERYEKINEMMADPAIVTDIKKLTELSKEQRGLEETVNVYTEYKEIAASIEDLKEMVKDSDPEISEMAELELEELKPQLPVLEERLEILFLKIRMMKKMLSWKFEEQQVEMKPIFLPQIYIVCIRSMQR